MTREEIKLSRYIDMLKAENKTLANKYTAIIIANKNLEDENSELKKEVWQLKSMISQIEKKQCKNNKMCQSFNKSLVGFMGMLDNY